MMLKIQEKDLKNYYQLKNKKSKFLKELTMFQKL